jgi:hypothetical protein
VLIKIIEDKCLNFVLYFLNIIYKYIMIMINIDKLLAIGNHVY